MSNEKIYVGNGEEFGNYGTIEISLCISDLPNDFITKAKNGKEYIRLKVKKKQQRDQYGKTHYVEVDTWRPNQ